MSKFSFLNAFKREETTDDDEVVFAGSERRSKALNTERTGGALKAFLSEMDAKRDENIGDSASVVTDNVELGDSEYKGSLSIEQTEDKLESKVEENSISNTEDDESEIDESEMDSPEDTEVETSDTYSTESVYSNNVSDDDIYNIYSSGFEDEDEDEDEVEDEVEDSDDVEADVEDDVEDDVEAENENEAKNNAVDVYTDEDTSVQESNSMQNEVDDMSKDDFTSTGGVDLNNEDDSVQKNEHKSCKVNPENSIIDSNMTLKEKFSSLDIEDRLLFVSKLFKEFEELSEYLVEYNDSISQKIDDLNAMIKSLYIKIDTCDLSEAMDLVAKIQKNRQHTKDLVALKDYLDSLSEN